MAKTDTLTRFLIDSTQVRGALVSLDRSWADVRGRSDYPAPVQRLLGEAAAAAALFVGHVKVDGRISLQLRGTGALRTLFAEATSAGTLRGIARVQPPVPAQLGLGDLGEGSMLAITIETRPPGQREMHRYQGLVGLDADTLDDALTHYFLQSEQLPTALLLAADGDRAAGLLLQRLPGVEGDADGWTRVQALFDTLSPAELLAGPDHELLWRLFHEDGVRVLSEQSLEFGCSCSRARVEDMLRGLGHDEASAAAETGEALIHCEFCGREYTFSPAAINELFTLEPTPNAPPAPGLQ